MIPKSPQPLLVYITTASQKEAQNIASILVSEKLAACANILGEHKSIYRWQGQLNSAKEISLLAKTTTTRLEELTTRVKTLHSYQCPCIIAWPITHGNPEFLQWIATETKN